MCRSSSTGLPACPSGTIFEHPAISLDLFATFAAAAGSEGTTEDSVNLLPYLRGQQSDPPHEFLFWRAQTDDGHPLGQVEAMEGQQDR